MHQPFDTKTLVTPQFMNLSSGPLSYRKSGSGLPLLLLHGWGGTSTHWYGAMNLLSDMRTVYALDLPGFGESPALAEKVSIARMADVVMEFADALELSHFDLNGHSFGGGVAAYLAAHHPERVEHLAVTSFGTCGNPLEYRMLNQMFYQTDMNMALCRPWMMMSQYWWQPWISLSQRWLVEMGSFSMLPQMIAQPFFYRMPSDERLLREGYAEFLLMDQRTSLESAMSLGDPSLREAMATITRPTLMICGKQDMVMPTAWIENAAQLLADSRIVWMADCGHVPMIERPNAYYCLLRHFFAGEMDTPKPLASAA